MNDSLVSPILVRILVRTALEPVVSWVTQVRDGATSLWLIRSILHPVIALVAPRMPRLSGLEVLRAVDQAMQVANAAWLCLYINAATCRLPKAARGASTRACPRLAQSVSDRASATGDRPMPGSQMVPVGERFMVYSSQQLHADIG